ncbi:MAG TPA: AraD1 family protein [Chthonomonadaceae bacterium]|nr:AraD1 family protein [Chthonomonadaceae bacterium]
MRLVQLHHPRQGRRVAVVEGERLWLLGRHATIYECALAAIERRERLAEVVAADLSDQALDYDPIYAGNSEWRLLPAFDHPDEPARCLVSGTGLTHRQGAVNRDAMHQSGQAGPPVVTDSMRMYEWGVAGGRPEPGQIGAQPEWFYKGCGTILRAHGEPLEVPAFADDGGEEPEIAGAYLIGTEGQPYRVGFAIGNEFSDHQMEKKNYLYLAPSKLRTCSLGPELAVDAPFDEITGAVRIERNGEVIWSHPIATGEAHMVHTLANLEHHHFKYPQHRRPGDAHIHFFGTGAFSFGAGVALADGDVMAVAVEGYGRPLRNPIRIDPSAQRPVSVEPL